MTGAGADALTFRLIDALEREVGTMTVSEWPTDVPTLVVALFAYEPRAVMVELQTVAGSVVRYWRSGPTEVPMARGA